MLLLIFLYRYVDYASMEIQYIAPLACPLGILMKW